MAANPFDEDSDELTEHQQKLKAALHFAVGKISEEATPSGLYFSRPTLACVNEALWAAADVWSRDLEAFAKHAKRAAINVDDVRLLMRRNTSLVGQGLPVA